MDIKVMKITDTIVLELFSHHDDFMLGFLGEDSRYYTRYTENEKIQKNYLTLWKNMLGTKSAPNCF